jgi:4-amino-4-deoxy-L-arabinose transferase-like glycosyltransferase
MKLLLIVLLAAAIAPFFVKLGDSSIWDANEAYYVETPREMIESGDYINPSFNYEPRFNKPVLSYWIVAGMYRVFGVSITVERLTIAVLAMIMIVAAWFLARAASLQPLAAPLAALGLAADPRFFMFSRRIFVDMAVTTMMSLTLLFFALSERYPSRRRLFLALMYVSVGLGVLTKGPVAAVIPFLVFIAYLAVHRELGRLREMMIPAGTLIALLIVAPWYVALYQQHGWTYITGFFIGENVGRFTETIGVQERGPLFYLPVLVETMLPWSLCLPAIVFAWRRDRSASAKAPADPPKRLRREGGRQHDQSLLTAVAFAQVVRLRTLLLLWIVVTVVLFSMSQTKQDLYIFPIVVAVAVLGGDWVARFAGPPGQREVRLQPDQNGDRWFIGTLTVIGIVMAALGAVILYFFGGDTPVYAISGARTSAWMAMAGGVLAAVLPWRRRHVAAVSAVLVVLIGFNWILALWSLPSFEQYKPVVPLSRAIAERAGPADVIAHSEVALPSMVYYLRRHIEDDLYQDQVAELLRAERRVFAVLPADRYESLKADYRVQACVVARQKTADIKLSSLLERWAPPEVLVISNRCPEL